MIKTIEVKKRFRLDELLKYVWDNKLNKIEAVSSSGRFKLKFIDNKTILVNSESTLGPFGSTVSLSTTEWEIEVEEEITEDTVFEDVVRVTREKEITQDKNMSINDCLDWKDYQVQIFAIIDGKLQLIWEAE